MLTVSRTGDRWRRSACRLSGCLAGAVLLLPALAAMGRDEGPSIRHGRFGSSVDARNRAVMPLTVTVTNPGPAVEAEVLAFSPGAASGQRLATRRRLILPEAGLVRVVFPFLADHPAHATGGIQSVVDLELGDGQRVRWDRFQTLGRVFPAESRATVVADARGAGFTWIETRDASGLSPGGFRFVFDLRELPRHAAAYAFADRLVLGSLGAHRLDAAQSSALIEWIAAGGEAVIVPSPDMRPADLGALEAILPGTWWDGERVESLQGEGTDDLWFGGQGGIWRVSLVARDGGSVARGPAQDPLALQGSHGRGRILLLGFDAGDERFQQAARAPEAWAALLPPDAPAVVVRGDVFARESERVQDLLRRMAGVRVASRTVMRLYLVVLLGGLAVMVGAGYAVRRPEWGWVGALAFAWAAGFALLAVTRSDAPARASLVAVTLARADADGPGVSLEGGLGFFSPHDASFRADLDDDRGFVQPGHSGIRPPPVFPTAWEDGRQGVGSLPVRARELRHAVAFARVDRPGLGTQRLTVGPDGMRLTAEPGAAPSDIGDAFLRWRRLAVPVEGALFEGRPGPSIRPESRGEGFRFSDRAVLRETDELQMGLLDLLFPLPVSDPVVWVSSPDAVAGGSKPDIETPALYGFSSLPVWPLANLEPEVERHALTLWRLPLVLEFSDDAITWPRGSLPRLLVRRPPLAAELPDGRVTGHGAADLEFAFALPVESPPMSVDRVRVFFDAEGDGYRFEAEVAPPEHMPGPPVPVPPGAVTSLESPARFRDARGRISVRVRIADTAGLPAHRLRRWMLHDLELEIAGRRLPGEASE